MFASNYNNMSKTIEVYLWRDTNDECTVDLVIDGETVFTKAYNNAKEALDKTVDIGISLGLEPIVLDQRNLIIKYSNQCEKK